MSDWQVRAPWALAVRVGLACGALWLGGLPADASAGGRLNDTGQVTCLVGGVVSSACAGTGQDAAYGRDVDFPDGSDGEAGFKFSKISDTGAVLPASAVAWTCVLDRVTGLMWEVKSDDDGLRDKDRVYRNRGGGQANEANALVRAVNAEGLCGQHDWRLPSREELMGLLDFGRGSTETGIDTTWFPHTVAGKYWTGTPSPDPLGAWTADFGGRFVGIRARKEALSVRLVRDQR